MDIGRIERAWSAGFFDGEGWAGTSGRGVFAQINQADPDGVPEVLLRFQRAVGVGRLGGPVLEEGKEPLYRWVVSSRADVMSAFEAIAPWLGEVKRNEFAETLGISGPASEWESVALDERTAWAAGLFDGEGWTGLEKHRSHKGRSVLAMAVTQASELAAPEVLVRLRDVLGGGHIYGPYRGARLPVYRWKQHVEGSIRASVVALSPYLNSRKRIQADNAIAVVDRQPKLGRGNPTWGAYKTHCVNGHEYATARIRPYRARKAGGTRRRNSKQCLACSREQAQARRDASGKIRSGAKPSSRSTRD